MDPVVHDVEHPGEQKRDPARDEYHYNLVTSQMLNSAVYINEGHFIRDVKNS